MIVPDACYQNHREFFDFYRDNSFMLDKLPGNLSRFKLTYDDCAAGYGSPG